MITRNLLLLLVALAAGGLQSIQGSINADLGRSLNHPLQATFISFFGAIIALIIVLAVLRPAIPSMAQLKSIPAINFTGGIYGIIFVTTVLVLAPKIGIANTLVAAIVGQVIVSVILDHFGLFGLALRPLSLYRLIGCAGLVISLLLIQKT